VEGGSELQCRALFPLSVCACAQAAGGAPRVGLEVASCQGGSIMMTSNCVLAMSRRQSYVVTLAWMGMQCGDTCRAALP
jgi:hypothetical protein